MRQVLFVVPGLGVAVHGFGLMFLLACWSALGLTAWRARRERIAPDCVYHLALWLFPGGMIGARLMFVVQHPETIHRAADLVRVWQGGIVLYGCILGGLIGALIGWVRRPFPFRAMADAVAPALAIGVALGRVGCFLNGCCFGGPCARPWAVRFPAGTLPWARHLDAGWITAAAPWSLAVHPTQLYEAVGALLLLGLLSAYYPRRRRDGQVMALLMMGYGALRFLVESLRGDEPAVLAGLTAAQAISAALLGGGLAFWDVLARRPEQRYADRAPATGESPLGPIGPGRKAIPSGRAETRS